MVLEKKSRLSFDQILLTLVCACAETYSMDHNTGISTEFKG